MIMEDKNKMSRRQVVAGLGTALAAAAVSPAEKCEALEVLTRLLAGTRRAGERGAAPHAASTRMLRRRISYTSSHRAAVA